MNRPTATGPRPDRVGPPREGGRGIIDPPLPLEQFTLNLYRPGPALDGLIEYFWAVSYRLPPGRVHSRQIITQPNVHLSIAHGQARADAVTPPLESTLTGVTRRIYTRHIAGTGWGVAAKSTPGGFGAFIDGSVADLAEKVVPIGHVLQLDDAALIADVDRAGDDTASDEGFGDDGTDGDGTDDAGAGEVEPARVAVLEARLTALAQAADPERVRLAREVAAVAELARSDRSLRGLDDLAAASGMSVRTLQRRFTEFAGISPSWVLRRFRLLEAAESVREGRPVVWAQVANDLGYSDQAHLVRDFRTAVGTTPGAYAQRPHALQGRPQLPSSIGRG